MDADLPTPENNPEMDPLEAAVEAAPPEPRQSIWQRLRRASLRRYWAGLLLFVYLVGLGSGFLLWGRAAESPEEMAARHAQENASLLEKLAQEVNPPEGHTLGVSYGDLGPQMLEAGAIHHDRFVQSYAQAGRPLTADQLAMLEKGSDQPIVFDQENAQFLLNFFWAFGLTNRNPILTEGPIVQSGEDKIGRFASTGGWSLGAKPPIALFASAEMVKLTAAQQERLQEVAQNVYRPCCDNPTHFPDCNHGMAMLGLLELLASQDASTDELFTAAKYANAAWYPSQSLELAQFFQASQKVNFAGADSRQLLSRSYSSGSGFRNVHQWLASNGLLQQAPGGGNSCGVQ